MVASIIGRKYCGGEQIKLSLRLATPTLKNAIALDVSVDVDTWNSINRSLKYYTKAYRRGSYFEVEGGLKKKLWTLLKAIDIHQNAGTLTLESAKTEIKYALRQDIIEEVQRQKVERAKQEEEEKRMTLMVWIAEFIKQCETGERLKQKSAKQITPGTIRSYKGTLAQLEAYQEKRHKVIDFDDVTLDFYDDWRRFFLEKKDARGNSRPYSPNTIGRHVKNLKIFLYAAKDMKLTTNTDFESRKFAADSQDVDNVYLTEERVQQMYETWV